MKINNKGQGTLEMGAGLGLILLVLAAVTMLLLPLAQQAIAQANGQTFGEAVDQVAANAPQNLAPFIRSVGTVSSATGVATVEIRGQRIGCEWNLFTEGFQVLSYPTNLCEVSDRAQLWEKIAKILRDRGHSQEIIDLFAKIFTQ